MSTDPNAAILAALADMEGRINERIDALDARQREDAASLRGDVATLRENTDALRGDVATSREDTASLAREIIAATDAAVTASEERLRAHVDLRMGQLTERVDRLEHKVEEGFTDTRADLARTRSSLREDALVEARTNEARLTAIERRLKALEESRRPA